MVHTLTVHFGVPSASPLPLTGGVVQDGFGATGERVLAAAEAVFAEAGPSARMHKIAGRAGGDVGSVARRVHDTPHRSREARSTSTRSAGRGP